MQKKYSLSSVAIALVILVSGCATDQRENLLDLSKQLPAANLMRPDFNKTSSEKIGLALSGGGTKAASYTMGVLAAVAQSDDEFKNIDAISSVSGGSYSSLFLFSKLILRDSIKNAGKPQIKDFFADCIPTYYQGPPKESNKPSEVRRDRLPTHFPKSMPNLCKNSSEENLPYLFQQYVRCRQDILENDCQPALIDEDKNEVKSYLKLFGETALIVAPNFIARSLFDWPVNLSPSRSAYKQGIWSTYGLYPTNMMASEINSDINNICGKAHFFNCSENEVNGDISPNKLSFEQLQTTLINNPDYPVWFINATASKKRSFLGWALSGQRDFSQYTLQMSPFGVRAGLYGEFTHKEPNSKFDLDLLEAVTASAAFADANQTLVKQPLRLPVAALFHLFGFDWGKDIENPNVDKKWRYLHNVLPFPLYYTDGFFRILGGDTEAKNRSSYVHLLDGGNNDDLGVFTLLEAGMRQIFISDSANDSEGKLGDLCLLHNELRINKLKLIIPGLEGLENHCINIADESEYSNGIIPNVVGNPTKGHYSILDWKYKVLAGCIRKLNDKSSCDSSEAKDFIAKIFLLKPAINLDEMKENFIDIEAKRVKTDACDEEKNPGLCEVAAFLVDSYDAKDEKDHGLNSFPQDSTVWMTAESDAKRYGAYRELGRWQMNEALKLSKDLAKFNEAIIKQTQNKISYDSEAN